VTRERWDADRVLRDAVLYRTLLLGEIASALPDDFRDRYPDVAWRQIRAFRNLAVHRYFSVVWTIALEEPPVLEEQALAIIRAEFPDLAQAYGPADEPEMEPERHGDDPDALGGRPPARSQHTLSTSCRAALPGRRRAFRSPGSCCPSSVRHTIRAGTI
jgi:uncharacterized protein with HEPN domain